MLENLQHPRTLVIDLAPTNLSEGASGQLVRCRRFDGEPVDLRNYKVSITFHHEERLESEFASIVQAKVDQAETKAQRMHIAANFEPNVIDTMPLASIKNVQPFSPRSGQVALKLDRASVEIADGLRTTHYAVRILGEKPNFENLDEDGRPTMEQKEWLAVVGRWHISW